MKKKQYTDKYEEKAFEFIGKLTKRNYRNNAIIFRKAANQIISLNPRQKLAKLTRSFFSRSF